MKKEDALKLATRCTQELTESLRGEGTERLRAYLDAMARFPNYSFGNLMMIMHQCPEASHVAGFHAWKQMGRWVKSGEKGIAIIAPMRRTEEDDSGETKKLFGFRVVHVFDVSQTDGKELFQLSEMTGDPGESRTRLAQVYRSLGIGIVYANLPKGTQGVSKGGRVVLRPGMTPEVEFSVMAHELGHELLHQRCPQGQRFDRQVGETEAEAVAYVVCQASGVDSRDLSSEYIRLHKGDAKTLEASFERVRATAAHILFLMDEMKQEKQEVSHAA